jgi:transcriptional regulator with PAS, ATPase and Fis domain
LPNIPSNALYPLKAADVADHPAPAPKPDQPFHSLKTFLRDQEIAHLNRALEMSGGDKEKAALLLGVSLATLYRKLAGEDRDG